MHAGKIYCRSLSSLAARAHMLPVRVYNADGSISTLCAQLSSLAHIHTQTHARTFSTLITGHVLPPPFPNPFFTSLPLTPIPPQIRVHPRPVLRESRGRERMVLGNTEPMP